MYQDITERKRAEEALRESEEHYRTLFDEALDGICLADAKTGIIFDCNQALAALVCRERAELIGQPQTILHPPQDDKTALSPTFKQHLADKEGQILETQIITKTGEIREVEIKANLLDIQGRKLLQGLFHDITERKRAEEERERLLAEIAAKNQELESFAYTISHDLRAPLVSMDGFYSLLKRESQDQLGEQGQHYLERIRANVAHMNTLVTELLELSRIGRVVGPKEEIDVGVLLREIEKGW